MIYKLVALFLVLIAGITIGWLLLPISAAVLLTSGLVAIGGWLGDLLRRPEPQ